MAYIPSANCDCAECGSDPCDLPFCCLELDTSGGNAGYDETFDVTGQFVADRNLAVAFEAYTITDQLILTRNGGTALYDSGCISGSVTPTVTVPAGTTSIRVQVVPRCSGETGDTAWLLFIACDEL